MRGLRDRRYWTGSARALRMGAPRRPHGALSIWLHAVSLGEVAAAAALVRALRARHPESPVRADHRHADGPARARRRCSAGEVDIRFLPYDTPGAVRAIPRAHPPAPGHHHGDRAVAESVPRVPAARRAGGVRERAPHGEDRCRAIAGSAACSGTLWRAARWSRRRVPRMPSASSPSAPTRARTHVIGNVKFDMQLGEAVLEQGRAAARALSGPAGRCGSPAAPMPARRSRCSTRTPHCCREIRGRIAAAGAAASAAVRERREPAEAPGTDVSTAAAPRDAVRPDAQVLLVDTVGELAALYAAADVAFVGGSLVPVGGHNCWSRRRSACR